MASKRLGPLPRRRGSTLALGCGRGGRVVLPLARAAAVSTGLSVRSRQPKASHGICARGARACVGSVRVRVRVRVRVLGLGLGC